jgi:hypothetical protein
MIQGISAWADQRPDPGFMGIDRKSIPTLPVREKRKWHIRITVKAIERVVHALNSLKHFAER